MQKQELNSHCEFYIRRFPRLKIKVVDGSSLAAAIVVNNIPKGTNEVLLRGKFDKVALAIVNALCKKNIKVCVFYNILYPSQNKCYIVHRTHINI
jgi:aldehyde decarbonylase